MSNVLQTRVAGLAAELHIAKAMTLPMALGAALAVLLAVELVAPQPQPAPVPVARAAPARMAANPPGSLLDAQLTVLRRPLFRPDRRPPRAAAVTVDDTVPRLSAIVITGAGRSAIFIDDGGSAVVLRPGGHIGAYQLQTVAPDSVRLLGPNGTIIARPSFAAAAAAPPPIAPVTPLSPATLGLFSNVPQ